MSEFNNSLDAIEQSESIAIKAQTKSKQKKLLFSLLICIGSTLALLGVLTLFVKFIIDEPEATLIAYQAQAPAKKIIKEKPKKTPPPTEEIPIVSNNTNSSISIEVPDIEIPQIDIDEIDLEVEDFELNLDSFSDVNLALGDTIEMTTMLGSKEIKGNSLAGYFYDLKQIKDKKTGKYVPSNLVNNNKVVRGNYFRILNEFVTKGWNEKHLKDYYRSENPLLTSQFLIPSMNANKAPEAFGLDDKVKPAGWLILYKGVIEAPYDCTFRFVGRADNVIMVRLKGKGVFSGNWSDPLKITQKINNTNTRKEPISYDGGKKPLLKGKWIKARKGEQMPIQVILGEIPGGGFWAHLTIEEKGVEYKQHEKGYPILPVFQTIKTSFPKGYSEKEYGIMDTGFIFKGAK